MEFWGNFFKTCLEGSVDYIISRDYIVNRRSFISVIWPSSRLSHTAGLATALETDLGEDETG